MSALAAPVRTLPGGANVALRAATQLAAAAGSPEFLTLVAASACRAAGVARCAVYLLAGEGRFRGQAAYPASHADAIAHIVCGGPADRITREIVETRAPVLIRDALTDPRAAQGALRAWKVRTVLGLPLLHGDDVTGVLYLDPGGAPATFTDAGVEAAAAIGRIAGELLGARAAFDAVRAERDRLERRNKLMCGASLAERRFGQAVLEGAGVGGIIAALAHLTGQPTGFYDARRHRVATSGEATFPGGDIDGIVAGGSGTLDPRLDEGVRHRHLVAPVDIGSDRCGWVVVVESNARLSAFDDLAIRRAARHIAIELAAARRATTAAWDARALLARQLLRGTQDADVRRGAELLGIDLGVPWIVGFLRAEEAVDDQALAGELERRVEGDVLATKGPEGVALLVAVPEGAAPLVVVRQLKQSLGLVCSALGLDAVAGLSAVCRDRSEVPRGYREAREVARCIDRFSSSGRGVLAADDLGPGRLFVARGDAAGIERFVDDVLGPLLAAGDDGLLATLHVFFDTGRSIRASGAQLAVHENTVRYRLARVRSLTGLDVAADASDQLSVQMALLVLRLRGHSALPGFEGEA